MCCSLYGMVPVKISTRQSKQVIDITNDATTGIPSEFSGVLNVFVRHTTAAVTTADLDPGGTDLDYLDALTKMVPQLKYRHPHDPSHMPDHILATLIGPSVTVPVENGKLQLGTWQRIVLFEFDGPRERKVVVTLQTAT